MTTCPVQFAIQYPDAEKKHHITVTKYGPVAVKVELVTLESVNFDKALVLGAACVIEGAVPMAYDPAPALAHSEALRDKMLDELKKKFTGGFYLESR